MSQQITTAFVQQYRDNVNMLIQQKLSKFEPCVRRETQNAEYEYYEYIGPVSAQPWGPRHGDTPLMETPHLRRRVGIAPWVWAELIDKPDRVRTLIDPTSPYAQNAVAAFNRRKDDIIIQAATAAAQTGYDGSVPVPFPAENNITLPTRLTVEALIELKEAFWNDDVDEGEMLVIACSPNQITALLDDERISSADYNNVKALVHGEVDTYMGFKFMRSTRLPKVQNGANFETTAIAWVPDGLLMAVGEEITVRIDERSDKKYSTQVFVSMDIGATRMEEKKVRTITTLDTREPHPAP